MLRLELPSQDLHSFEGLDRMLDSLSQLQEAAGKAFANISSRMQGISSRVSSINEKRASLESKIDIIEKSEIQYNLKFSSLARYPTKKKTIGKPKASETISLTIPSRLEGFVSNNVPASSDSKGKAPEIKYDEAAELVNKNFTKINQFHATFEGEFNVMNVGLH